MNAAQIENILQLIDGNLAITRQEAIKYIQEHRQKVAESMASSGVALIPTSAGQLELTVADLEASVA